MQYCKFHPLTPATFSCDHCQTELCDHCVDDSPVRGGERCFSCGNQLTTLGAAYSADPFWRKLQEAFRYPLNSQSLSLIIGASLLLSIAAYIPFAIVIYLMGLGALIRYSFACLEDTANGKMTAPDITEAYDGGIVLIFQLIAIMLIMGAAVVGVGTYISEGLARLLAVLCILSLPAIIILFALNRNLLAAINPLSIIQLITSVGLSYGVLLGLILVMSASVSVIHALIGAEFSFINLLLQGIVSNFYTVVAFHIMGYMIFQYQGELGFVAREDFGEAKQGRDDKDRHSSKIDIALKLGHYNQVVDLFAEANSKFPHELIFYTRCFDFLCAVKMAERLEKFMPHYFDFLVKAERADQIYPSYKRALTITPNYMPAAPKLRHQLAEICLAKGDPRTALKLINGLHKQHPTYAKLPAAYQVMERALADMPNMAKQQEQCKRLIETLKQKAAEEAEKQAEKAAANSRKTNTLKDLNTKKSASEKPALGTTTQTAPLRRSEMQKQRAAEHKEKQANGVDADDKDLPPIEFKL